MAYTHSVGKWDFELYAALKFFTTNTDAVALIPGAQSRELEQKAIGSLTGHAVYNFSSKWWTSVDAAWRTGGESRVDGTNQDNRQAVLGIGAAVNYSPSIYHQFGMSYFSSVAQNEYGPEGSLFNIKYAYVFGGKIRQTMQAMQQQMSAPNP